MSEKDAMLSNLLQEFWIWFGLSADQYALSGHGPKEEFMFPEWSDLIRETKEAIKSENNNIEILNNILAVLALDNEREEILDYISEYSSVRYIQTLAKQSLTCNQAHARWQIAELIGRRKELNCKETLIALTQDKNPYVQRRANISLHRLS